MCIKADSTTKRRRECPFDVLRRWLKGVGRVDGKVDVLGKPQTRLEGFQQSNRTPWRCSLMLIVISICWRQFVRCSSFSVALQAPARCTYGALDNARLTSSWLPNVLTAQYIGPGQRDTDDIINALELCREGSADS